MAESAEEFLGTTQSAEDFLGASPKQTQPKPGYLKGQIESLKAVPRTALNIGTSMAAFPFMAPQWAVGMQEKYEGKPYEGLLTKKIGDKTIAEHAQGIGQAIQKLGEPKTEPEKRTVEAINLPFKELAKAGEFVGKKAKEITGSPSAGTLAEAATNLSPILFASPRVRGAAREAVGKPIEMLGEAGEGAAEYGYRGAIRPEKRLSLADREAMIKEGLKTGTAVKESGVMSLESLQNKQDIVNGKIAKIVDEAEKRGATVKTKPIINEIQKAKKLYPEWHESPEIEKMIDTLSKRDEIPIKEAHGIKQQIQHSQRKNYGKLTALASEGEKYAGHAILDQMIKENPELKSLGLEDKAMIQLETAITNRLKTLSPFQLATLRQMSEVGVGAVLGAGTGHGLLGTLIGVGAAIMEHPTVRSTLAIALDRASQATKRVGQAISGVKPSTLPPGTSQIPYRAVTPQPKGASPELRNPPVSYERGGVPVEMVYNPKTKRFEPGEYFSVRRGEPIPRREIEGTQRIPIEGQERLSLPPGEKPLPPGLPPGQGFLMTEPPPKTIRRLPSHPKGRLVRITPEGEPVYEE